MIQDDNEFGDEFGARYSSDGKTLLRVPEDFTGESQYAKVQKQSVQPSGIAQS